MKEKLKKLAPWIILALILLGTGIWYLLSKRITQEQITSYQQIISEADSQYEAREYSTAINRYYDATDVIPSRVEAYEGIVDILLLKNRTSDAKEIVEKSAKKLSNYDRSVLYLRIGNKYYEDSLYDQALSTYLDGLGVGVTNPELELSIAKTYMKKGKFDDANTYLNKPIYTEDTLNEATLLRAYILATTNADDAKKVLDSIQPSDTWKAFYDEFSLVLESMTDDVKFNAAKLSRVYINSGYPALAVNLLEPLSEDITEYLEGVYFLGRAYLDVGEYDKAIIQYDRALSLGGMEEDILWGKARAYLLQDDLENSFESYSKAISYGGEDVSAELVAEYLDLLLKSSQTLRADEMVKKLMNYISSPYVCLYGVKVNKALNDSKKVDYYLGLLSKMKLNDAEKKEYMYLNASNLLAQGKTDSVAQVLEELVKLDRFNPQYYFVNGQLEYTLGNKDNAKEMLKKAIEYDTNNLVTEEANQLLSQI